MSVAVGDEIDRLVARQRLAQPVQAAESHGHVDPAGAHLHRFGVLPTWDRPDTAVGTKGKTKAPF